MLLDVDPVVLDELLEDDCCCTFDGSPAEWIAGCRTCPRQVLWCQTHHDKVMTNAMDPARSFHCRGCGATTTDWHAQFYTRLI